MHVYWVSIHMQVSLARMMNNGFWFWSLRCSRVDIMLMSSANIIAISVENRLTRHCSSHMYDTVSKTRQTIELKLSHTNENYDPNPICCDIITGRNTSYRDQTDVHELLCRICVCSFVDQELSFKFSGEREKSDLKLLQIYNTFSNKEQEKHTELLNPQKKQPFIAAHEGKYFYFPCFTFNLRSLSA